MFDMVTEYLAAKEALLDLGVDCSAIEAGDAAAIAANRANDSKTETEHQKKTLEIASKMLQESFSTEIARRQKEAPGAKAQQAGELATEAGKLVEVGRLTDAAGKYQEALELLGSK